MPSAATGSTCPREAGSTSSSRRTRRRRPRKRSPRASSRQAKTAAPLAESLLRQPFLPGEEGSWVEEKRRELADVRGRALTALADTCLRSGDAREAVKWAEQTIALAPFRETGYRRLMDAHVADGNRAEALRVYERCRRLLADELGAYPSPETESIYRGLLEAPAAQRAAAPLPEAPPPASALLVVPEGEPDGDRHASLPPGRGGGAPPPGRAARGRGLRACCRRRRGARRHGRRRRRRTAATRSPRSARRPESTSRTRVSAPHRGTSCSETAGSGC